MFKTIGLSLIYLILFLGLYGCSCSKKPTSESLTAGLYIADAIVKEGEKSDYEITVSLKRENQDAVSVDYTIAQMDGTVNTVATAGTDFIPKNGKLVFSADSDDTQTISFSIINDDLYEHDEKFIVRLSNPSGAKIIHAQGPNVGQAIVTIESDDLAPVASFSVISALENTTFAENEVDRIQLKVSLDTISGVDASMTIRKSAESASDFANANFGKVAANRIDYLLKNVNDELLGQIERIIIPEGKKEVIINLDVVDDGIVENTESFTLTLSDPVDTTIGTAGANLEFHIIDNDQIDLTKPLVQPLNDTGITQGVVSVIPADLPDGGIDLNNSQLEEQLNQLQIELGNELDKAFGRDAEQLASILVKKGGGKAGFDFTRLDSEGKETYADSYDADTDGKYPWDCVRDNNTGLVWEMKTKGNLGLRAESGQHYWYDPNFATNGGDPGDSGNFECGGADGYSTCNTAYYVADINSMKLCGLRGWRLPTLGELRSIVDYSAVGTNLAFDTNYFADDKFGDAFIWTSTTNFSDRTQVWTIRFGKDAFSEGVIAKSSATGSGIRLVNDSLLKQAQQ